MGAERLAASPSLRDALIQRAEPEGPAVFVHSSGSTGKPKGVVLSHRNLLAGVRNAYRGGAFQFDETILAYLPIAWVGDFAVTMGPASRFTSPSTFRSGRKQCCTICARLRPPSIWPRRAAGTTC